MRRATTVSFACISAISFIALVTPSSMAIDGPLANATVSFGQWQTDPPLNRFPTLSPGVSTVHQLIPQEVMIKAGGSVNFVIGGFHHPIVYGDGAQPEDINFNLTTPSTGMPSGVALINDPANRIYRGLDPSRQPPLLNTDP